MTFRTLQKYINNMRDEQLDMEVMLYDLNNDCYPDALHIYKINEEILNSCERDGLNMDEDQVIISF